MKKFLLSAAAILIVSPAVAADLSRPVLKAPMMPPAYSWTGFYIGVNGGGAWGESRYDFTGVGTTTGNFNISGGFVGGTFGYNWQVTNWVLGIEGDIDAADIKGSALCPNPSFTCAVKDEWLATVRGRLGFLVNPNWLIYGTAGLAVGGFKHAYTETRPGVATRATTDSDTRAGWTAGGGVEYAFTRQWSLGVEYLYMDFGTSSLNEPVTGPVPSSAATFDDKSHVVRAKVNYKFDWTTPLSGR